MPEKKAGVSSLPYFRVGNVGKFGRNLGPGARPVIHRVHLKIAPEPARAWHLVLPCRGGLSVEGHGVGVDCGDLHGGWFGALRGAGQEGLEPAASSPVSVADGEFWRTAMCGAAAGDVQTGVLTTLDLGMGPDLPSRLGPMSRSYPAISWPRPGLPQPPETRMARRRRRPFLVVVAVRGVRRCS